MYLTTTQRRFILFENNIFDLMKAILNMPMYSNSLGKLSSIFGHRANIKHFLLKSKPPIKSLGCVCVPLAGHKHSRGKPKR